MGDGRRRNKPAPAGHKSSNRAANVRKQSRWSPDGKKLAFDLCLDCEPGGSNYEIFIANLKIGTLDTLVQHPYSDTHPTWSPDGKRMAFASDRDYYDADALRIWRYHYETTYPDGAHCAGEPLSWAFNLPLPFFLLFTSKHKREEHALGSGKEGDDKNVNNL